jgi:hypothetical protein
MTKTRIAVDWTFIRKNYFFCDRCKEFEEFKYPVSLKELKGFNLKHSGCLLQLELFKKNY